MSLQETSQNIWTDRSRQWWRWSSTISFLQVSFPRRSVTKAFQQKTTISYFLHSLGGGEGVNSQGSGLELLRSIKTLSILSLDLTVSRLALDSVRGWGLPDARGQESRRVYILIDKRGTFSSVFFCKIEMKTWRQNKVRMSGIFRGPCRTGVWPGHRCWGEF